MGALMPAQAGIQALASKESRTWMPAFAGMTNSYSVPYEEI